MYTPFEDDDIVDEDYESRSTCSACNGNDGAPKSKKRRVSCNDRADFAKTLGSNETLQQQLDKVAKTLGSNETQQQQLDKVAKTLGSNETQQQQLLVDKEVESLCSPRNGDDDTTTKGNKWEIIPGGRTIVGEKTFENTDSNVKRRLNIYGINTRILERRYSLTKTGYKYLNVGIDVRPPARAIIALGDRNTKEINLSYDAWKKLLEQKSAILSHLQEYNNESKRASLIHLTMRIENLKLRFSRINNLPILRMETPNVRLSMSRCTLLNMFNLEYCVNRLMSSLSALTGDVDKKLKQLNDIASANAEDTNVLETMYGNSFDPNDIVACELIALLYGETY